MPAKGFGHLVDAIELLKANGGLLKKPLVLTFGEDGFFARELRNIREKGIEEHFVFLPFNPDIASVLKGLDVVAMPSIWEACPIVPMEAMVAGVPVIGSDCVGLREVLKDTPNVVVPSAKSAALAEAIRSEMQKSSRSAAEAFQLQAAQRFDVRQRVAELEKVFKDLMRSKRKNK
jgi:glycosyltransferase involved in cell wall biosynthesis